MSTTYNLTSYLISGSGDDCIAVADGNDITLTLDRGWEAGLYTTFTVGNSVPITTTPIPEEIRPIKRVSKLVWLTDDGDDDCRARVHIETSGHITIEAIDKDFEIIYPNDKYFWDDVVINYHIGRNFMGKIMYKNQEYGGLIEQIHPIDTIDLVYPVGSYYETSDVDFDPNEKWGGEWINETRQLVSATGSKTVNSAAFYDLASLTLSANTKYLIIGNVNSSTSTSQVQLANFKMTGTPTTWWNLAGRTTAQAGGGTHGIAYVDVGNSNVTITLQCYGYNTSSHTETGKIIAFPIDRPADVYRWHRTA